MYCAHCPIEREIKSIYYAEFANVSLDKHRDALRLHTQVEVNGPCWNGTIPNTKANAETATLEVLLVELVQVREVLPTSSLVVDEALIGPLPPRSAATGSRISVCKEIIMSGIHRSLMSSHRSRQTLLAVIFLIWSVV